MTAVDGCAVELEGCPVSAGPSKVWSLSLLFCKVVVLGDAVVIDGEFVEEFVTFVI